MGEITVDTKDLSKEEVERLLKIKDEKLQAYKVFTNKILDIYEEHKVSDTMCIQSGKYSSFLSAIEPVLARIRTSILRREI